MITPFFPSFHCSKLNFRMYSLLFYFSNNLLIFSSHISSDYSNIRVLLLLSFFCNFISCLYVALSIALIWINASAILKLKWKHHCQEDLLFLLSEFINTDVVIYFFQVPVHVWIRFPKLIEVNEYERTKKPVRYID